MHNQVLPQETHLLDTVYGGQQRGCTHERGGTWVAALCLALYVAMEVWKSPVCAQLPRPLAGFENLAQWQVGASDGVRASLSAVKGLAGQALCLEFDFAGVAGYASARRVLSIDFPLNYEFAFYVRGEAPVNNLEFKLVYASGDNVWWVNYRDFAFPREWQQVNIKKRQIEFAWGPTPDRALTHSAAPELVVKAGSGGGRGLVCFDQLSLRELPPQTTSHPTPILHASSAQPGMDAPYALDGALSTTWKSAPVVNVNVNPDNPIANTRSFGDDPERVARLAEAVMCGMQGHGLAAWDDSQHAGGAYRPASISPTLVTGLLRGELGFQGLIVTDDMNMGGGWLCEAAGKNRGLHDRRLRYIAVSQATGRLCHAAGGSALRSLARSASRRGRTPYFSLECPPEPAYRRSLWPRGHGTGTAGLCHSQPSDCRGSDRQSA
jgi:hypothetical protein